MADRTTHNLINAAFFGYSGNDIHKYMDRAAKDLRQKHRRVGHDIPALLEMYMIFKNKYTRKQITETWALHKVVDGIYSGLHDAVRAKNEGYGKKSILKVIKRLKKEAFR